MKQTNNAIKFLMAQYRAIFKNAYFKGLTSALVLTAGLAAGQAQAYDFNDAHTTLHDYVIDSKGNHWTGPDSGSNGNSTVTTTYSGAAQYANTIILNNGGTLTSESETNAGEENLYVNSITVNDGGKIELTGANASGGGIQGPRLQER